ncbi:MAG: insulinase family protein [Bacteroidales bacterium]|nr:insulinase family protein [Bacteroidales bacterium]MDZ4204128.1 insulinase family protein [Bacteroidales bacterium]
MHHIKTLIALLLLSLLPFCLSADNPLEVKKFTLKNGLTVYLNEDHAKPEIFGAVVVKTGSCNDPDDATGIAHYFEHIMFKGTDRIGTINWEAEKVYLDSISMYYDQLFETADPAARTAIQKKINQLSLKAAEYAIPNEVDVLLRDIGGEMLNAFTSFEQTVYHNSFPANQLEKWMEIYAERFRNPVFRLFQSELETVYEEKNLYSDRPMQLMIEDLLQTFYKDHPFSKPIIGTTEHLKNPRLSKMMGFYNTWYVANNMALILAGSFNSDEIIPMIEEKFGSLRSAELPTIPDCPLAPFNGREFKQVRMSPIRIGVMGYRTVPALHADNLVFDITSKLLSNSAGTGIFDKMVMDNKIMAVQGIPLQANDHGSYLLLFIPKIVGQKFSAAEELTNQGLKKLRDGDFSDELLEAVKLEYRKEAMRNLETHKDRAYMLMEAFVQGKEWKDLLDDIELAGKITREDIIRVAKTYLDNNRFVYYSKMGFPKKDKLQKPDWEPVIPQNADKQSEFSQMLDEKQVGGLEPTFIDFGKDVKFETIRKGYDLYHTQNPYNQIFTLDVEFRTGNLHNPLLPNAASYMNLIGTANTPYQQFKQELQNLGSTLAFYSGDNNFTVSIEGFDDQIEATLRLVNEILTNPGKDDSQLEKMVQDIQANNKTRRDDPMAMANALQQYALYGSLASDMRNITLAEAKKIKSEQLLEAFKEAINFDGHILYTGSLPFESVRTAIINNLSLAQQPRSGDYIEFDRTKFNENTVYLHHNSKARQSNLHFYVEGNALTENDKALANAFNEYFGGSMSSLVFQEIREFRSLAYAARATLRMPFLREKPSYLMGFINTQSDKTLDAAEAMSELILQMPEKPDRMEGIRKGLLQSIHTSQPDFRQLNSTVARWRRQGYVSDPRKDRYFIYNRIAFSDIVDFYNAQLHKKPLLISVSGNLKGIDRKKLGKYGKIVELKFVDFIRE